MKKNRRDVLIQMGRSSVLLLAPWMSACTSFGQKTNLSNGPGIYFFTIRNSMPNHPNGHIIGGETALYIYNSTKQSMRKVPLDMKYPHSMICSPIDRDIAVISPREAPLALVVNVRDGTVIHRLKLENDEHFYGHGFFSPNGKALYLTGYTRSGEGFFREFDSAFKPVGDIDSYGESPHDCALVDQGRTIIVANTAQRIRGKYATKKSSSISFIDFKTRKLLEQVKLPPSFTAFQHLSCLDSGDLVVACDDNGKDVHIHGGSSLVAYKKRNQPLRFLDCPLEFRQRMAGNTLSVLWHESSGTVITTTPSGPVTIWSLKEMKAIRQELHDQHPHGLAEIEKDTILLTTANNGVWQAKFLNGRLEPFQKIGQPDSHNISAHSLKVHG